MQEQTQLPVLPPLSGPALIDMINKIAQTLGTNFSGSDDPAALAWPYATWADTGAGLLKRRNAADSAWVTVGKLLDDHSKAGAIDLSSTISGLTGTTVQAALAEIWSKALMPAGIVVPFAGPVANIPTGFLPCNGATVVRATYAALFTAIGTTYGAGNGSTTFVLPDFRGEFLRGLDGGRGVDVGRTLGSAQTDEFRAHRHGSIPSTSAAAQPAASGVGGINGYIGATEYAGGSETRPRNIAVNYIIKY